MSREDESLSFEELEVRDEGSLVAEVVQRVLEREGAVGLSAMTVPERSIYFAFVMEFQVLNGGFHQFFWNSSGDWACQTLAALEVLDVPEHAEVFRKALAVFPESRPPQDRLERIALMHALPDEFAAWKPSDGEFYALPEFSDAALARYIREHRAELPGGRT